MGAGESEEEEEDRAGELAGHGHDMVAQGVGEGAGEGDPGGCGCGLGVWVGLGMEEGDGEGTGGVGGVDVHLGTLTAWDGWMGGWTDWILLFELGNRSLYEGRENHMLWSLYYENGHRTQIPTTTSGSCCKGD